jgi:two-component system cell cycle sensor histidine kinase/response regulator CckA
MLPSRNVLIVARGLADYHTLSQMGSRSMANEPPLSGGKTSGPPPLPPLEKIVAASPHIIYIYDIQNQQTVFTSRRVDGHLGYSLAQIDAMGPNLHVQIMHPDDLRAVQASLKQWETATDSEVVESEYRMRHADGSYRWFLSTSSVFERDAGGRVRSIVGNAQDITQRKLAEQKREASDIRFRSVFELPLIGIAITSLEKGWLEVNDRLCEMLGYPCEELTKLTWAELTHPDDLDADVSLFNKVLRGELEGYSLDKRFIRKDGTVIHTALSVRCVRKPDRSVDYFVALLQDISDRKLAEEHLRQTQKVESIGRLAGGVAHDFNNLLTSILGFCELARMHAPAAVLDFLDCIEESTERGAALTRQLLAFARRQIVKPEAVDLNAVLHRLEPLLKRLIGEDVELDFNCAPNLGIVKVDVGSFEQVVMNLAVNARDAMAHGGRLTFSTRSVELADGDAHLRGGLPPGEYVRLSACDTGAGIPPEIRERIFEPFFTTKPVGQGTGLGLAMCHGIIKQAEGHIDVESEPGKGATFNIFLPRVHETPAPAAPAPTKPAPAAAIGHETILLVEDDNFVRELACRILSKMGYRTLVAADGVEALEIVERNSDGIHLLVTDVVMPRMGGNELARKMTARDPNLKVLFASGYTEDAIVSHGVLKEGVNFLAKPYTPTTLAEKVRAVLDSK